MSRQAELRDSSDDDGFIEDHLWTGIARVRAGCGAAIVGDPDQVVAKLRAYMDLGIDAFIVPGYPHLAECDLVAGHVLSSVENSSDPTELTDTSHSERAHHHPQRELRVTSGDSPCFQAASRLAWTFDVARGAASGVFGQHK